LTTTLLAGLLLVLALLTALLAAALLAGFLLATLVLLAGFLLATLATLVLLAALIFVRHFYLFLRSGSLPLWQLAGREFVPISRMCLRVRADSFSR
jgi:hypothetical protein